jgi:hypothetical protein
MQTPHPDGSANGPRVSAPGSPDDASQPPFQSRDNDPTAAITYCPPPPHEPSARSCTEARHHACHRVDLRPRSAPLRLSGEASHEASTAHHPGPAPRFAGSAPDARQRDPSCLVCGNPARLPETPRCTITTPHRTPHQRARLPPPPRSAERYSGHAAMQSGHDRPSAHKGHANRLCTHGATRDYYVLHEKLRCPRTTSECLYGSA